MKKPSKVSPDDALSDDVFEAFEEHERGAAPADAVGGTKAPSGPSAQEMEGLADFGGLDADAGRLEPDPQRSAGEDGPQATEGLPSELAGLAPDVPVNLVAVIGKTTINLGELIKYRMGQVIDLGRTPGETVDLVANGRLIARGELVEMDGKLGVRVLKMVR